MSKMLITGKTIGKGNPVFVIAEMACAHNGNLDSALRLVDVAVEAGADAVQLQIFSVKDYIVPHHPIIDLIRKLEMKPQEWYQVMKRVKDCGIALFVAAYDRPSVDLSIENGVDAFKIHSADLSNPYLTEYIAAKGKPITLSTGASTIEEIEEGINFIKGAGCSKIILMHGYQSFPTKIEEANLRFADYLKGRFGLPIGYQDHTDGDDPMAVILPLVAAGLGVDVLEKHFNLDRKEKGVDYQSSLNPDELKHFIGYLRSIEKSFGRSEPGPFTADEEKYRKSCKKSVVASRDIEAGGEISQVDLLFMRSTPGLPPTEMKQLIGRKTKRLINKYENLLVEDVV
ncbi:MAG: N-acetylneuraminate synthase family protein [Pseudomonadota bacterium]